MKTIPLPPPSRSLPASQPRELAARWAPFVSPAPPALSRPFRSPLVDYLDDLVASGGPEPGEYARLGATLREIAERAPRGIEGSRLLASARAALAPTLIKGTVSGFAHLRPHGYAGDFELIERVLSFHHSTDPNLVRWDRYCHSLPAACALRSRTTHLWNLLRRLEREPGNHPIRTLSFRSGPARDMADYCFTSGPNCRVYCDCVDPDPNAALHGRRITARVTDRLSFHTRRLLSFRPGHAYQLAWSSILAEDLEDAALVAVLRRLLQFLEPGGRLVLCQLAPDDASAAALEILAGWQLRRRDARSLAELALAAGAFPDAVRVLRDPAHANLYLHIWRPHGPLRRRLRFRPHLTANTGPAPTTPPAASPPIRVNFQPAPAAVPGRARAA